MDDELKACSQATIELRSLCDEYYARIKRLEAERDDLRLRLAARSADLATAQETIAALRTDLTTLNEAFSKVATQVEEWRKVAYDTQRELEDTQATVKELEAERAAQDDELRRVYAERAQTASAPAGRMEYLFERGGNHREVQIHVNQLVQVGWQYVDVKILQAADDYLVIMQRPVASGGQVSEGSEVVAKAIDMLRDYGNEDGAHHKMWVIDQTLRILMGQEYQEWRREHDPEYGWSKGIAP